MDKRIIAAIVWMLVIFGLMRTLGVLRGYETTALLLVAAMLVGTILIANRRPKQA